MRPFILIYLFWLTFSLSAHAQVTVTDTQIITPHDTIPRFKGATISSDFTFDQPQQHEHIEIMAGATLTVSDQLWVNTITIFEGGTLSLLPGAELIFNGAIPDQDGGQFGLGIINLGLLKSRGTPKPQWSYNGQDYVKAENDVKLIGEDRAHTMTIGMGRYDLHYVDITGLGRTTVEPVAPITNQIGRYPIHIHRGHGTIPSQFKGVVIRDWRKFAVAVHDSRIKHLMDDCWVIGEGKNNRINGSGFVTEMGTEYGLTLRHCLATGVYGIDRPIKMGDEAFEGNGFWFHGIGGLVLEDCVADDCRFGFTNFTPNNPNSLVVDGVTLTRSQLIPASWKGNTASRCEVDGIDMWPDQRAFWFEDQVIDRCANGFRQRGFQIRFRNPTITNCALAMRTAGYTQLVHIDGGRIENCGDGISVAFGVHVTGGTQFLNNGTDLNLKGLRWASDVDVTLDKKPTIQFAMVGPQFVQQAQEKWEFQRSRKIAIPEGTFELRSPVEFKDEPYPDGGWIFAEPTTVQEAWDKWNVGINGKPPADPALATYLPGIVDHQGNMVPLLPPIAPPVRPLKAYIGKLNFDIDFVYVMYGGNNSWNNTTDIAELWADGVLRSRTSQWPSRFKTPLAGVQQLELRLFRNGELVSNYIKNLDGTPPPEEPVDPDAERLAELRARELEIQTELAVLAAQTAALTTELAAVQAEIAELED